MTTDDLPLEHVHVGDDSGTDAPAVFVLHGRGADEEDLLSLARHLPDALSVVSLRAPAPLGPGYTWYELDLSAGSLHESQPDPDDLRRSLDLVSESVGVAVDAYGLDPDALGLLGFSQGAVLGFCLLLEDPRYAWTVGLHGYLPDAYADREPDGVAGTPVFVGAGSRDGVIPAHRAEAAADRLRAVGCDVTFEAYDAAHGIGADELRDVVAFVERRTEGE